MITSKFRSNVWDPLLIVTQMISMQLQFYFTLTLLIYSTHLFFNLLQINKNDFYSLDKLFNFKKINFVEISGRFNIISFLANSLVR
jgi:hypothetical protein